MSTSNVFRPGSYTEYSVDAHVDRLAPGAERAHERAAGHGLDERNCAHAWKYNQLLSNVKGVGIHNTVIISLVLCFTDCRGKVIYLL